MADFPEDPHDVLPEAVPAEETQGSHPYRGRLLAGLALLVVLAAVAAVILRPEGAGTTGPAPTPGPSSALLGGPPPGSCTGVRAAPAEQPSIPLTSPEAPLRAGGGRLQLRSAAGEDVLGGCNLDIVDPPAPLEVDIQGEVLRVQAGELGGEVLLTLAAPRGEKLAVGRRYEAVRTSFRGERAGVETIFLGRACASLAGFFVIEKLERVGAKVITVDASFEQQCDVSSQPLRGELQYSADSGRTSPSPG